MPPEGIASARQAVDRAVTASKEQQTAIYKGWEITSYFGPCLGLGKNDVHVVTWTAIATNKGRNVLIQPDLEHDRTALRADFDSVCIVVFSGRTQSILNRKLKKAFPGFQWTKKK